MGFSININISININKKKAIILSAVCALLLIGVAVVLLLVNIRGPKSHEFGQDHEFGFVVVRPDPTAPQDKITIDVIKMFPVNKKADNWIDSINGVAQTCRNYNNLNGEDNKNCPPMKNNTILIVDLKEDAACYEYKYNTVEKLANLGVKAMILLENGKTQNINKIGKTSVDFDNEAIEFPIVSVRSEDFKGYTSKEYDTNCKDMTMIFNDLEKELEYETSALFEVDCHLGNYNAKVAWKNNDEKCPNNKNHIFFAQVEEETAPMRCIDVTIKCFEQGLKCKDLLRFQEKWSNKHKSKFSNTCPKMNAFTESNNNNERKHFNKIMPLICKERGKYLDLHDLLCGDLSYVKDEKIFWRWDRKWNHDNVTNWCCNDNNKMIMFSNSCFQDKTSFGIHQKKGWSKIFKNSKSPCTFHNQGNTISQKSYRFNKYDLPGCILIEETQEWCKNDSRGNPNDVTEDNYKNNCQNKQGKYQNVPDCKNFII